MLVILVTTLESQWKSCDFERGTNDRAETDGSIQTWDGMNYLI